MIARSFDASAANRIVNHQEVQPFVSFDDTPLPMDLSAVVANTSNVLMMSDLGGFMFSKQEDEVYHIHTFFLNEGRGRYALLCARDAIEWMFLNTDCMEVLTVVPDDVTYARPPKAMGWVFEFRRDGIFTRNGKRIGAEFWALRYNEWAKKVHGMVKHGHAFHEKLGEDQTHEEDLVHDRYVGICSRMVASGQVHKAVFLYNRWACFAGYEPLLIESEGPFILRMGKQKLKLSDDLQGFEVMTCQ